MKKLMRSSNDKILYGVCAGIADYFGIDPLIVRIIFIFVPSAVLVYIVLALLLPEKPTYYS